MQFIALIYQIFCARESEKGRGGRGRAFNFSWSKLFRSKGHVLSRTSLYGMKKWYFLVILQVPLHNFPLEVASGLNLTDTLSHVSVRINWTRREEL